MAASAAPSSTSCARSTGCRARSVPGSPDRACIAALEKELHRAPTDEEIAKKLGVTEEELDDSLLEISVRPSARSTSCGRRRRGRLDRPLDTSRTSRAPTRNLARADGGKEALAEAISELPEREKLVVTLYYYEELTLPRSARCSA